MTNTRMTKTIMTSLTRLDVASPIPVKDSPPNDMRPRKVDRAKVQAARKAARRNRRKR